MTFSGKIKKKKKWMNLLKLFEDGKYTDIVNLLEREELDPVEELLLAECFLAVGDKERAVEHYRRSLEEDPLNFKASFNLALLLDEMGEKSEALTFYRRAYVLFPWRQDLSDKLREMEEIEKETFKLPGATPELKELFEAIERMGERESLRWFKREEEERNEKKTGEGEGEARSSSD